MKKRKIIKIMKLIRNKISTLFIMPLRNKYTKRRSHKHRHSRRKPKTRKHRARSHSHSRHNRFRGGG